jgi:nucleoside-triphosphatase THEP1
MNKQIYYRLISLWVLSEAMLGGIVHGLNIPVSGLVVGSCAVACISLLAWYVPVKGAILKATIIVAVFKMMLSPQAPPPAYVAVFFQGFLGEVLFRSDRKFFRASCLIFATIALLESGLQRILILTVIYGNDLWVVINEFINRLTRQKVATNYSLVIGSGYVLVHILAGIAVGMWTAGLPVRIEKWSADRQNTLLLEGKNTTKLTGLRRKRKRKRRGLFVIWLLLLALYVQSYYKIGTPLLPHHLSLKILLRSLIIVLTWVFVVAPLLKTVLQQWLQRKQSAASQQVQSVLDLLPATQQLAVKSWKQAGGYRGWSKVRRWIQLVLVNALSSRELYTDKEVILLVAPVQTGKTTSLVGWSADRDDVHGILTPVVNGKRMFMDANSRQLFLMEAREGETDTVAIGKYMFSRQGFEKATEVIRQAMQKDGWLVIDEIGPLELRGEGFHGIVKEVLQQRRKKLILVIRDKEEMVEKVKAYFGITESVQISHAGAL